MGAVVALTVAWATGWGDNGPPPKCDPRISITSPSATGEATPEIESPVTLSGSIANLCPGQVIWPFDKKADNANMVGHAHPWELVNHGTSATSSCSMQPSLTMTCYRTSLATRLIRPTQNGRLGDTLSHLVGHTQQGRCGYADGTRRSLRPRYRHGLTASRTIARVSPRPAPRMPTRCAAHEKRGGGD
jgi:hypothetical protein